MSIAHAVFQDVGNEDQYGKEGLREVGRRGRERPAEAQEKCISEILTRMLWD